MLSDICARKEAEPRCHTSEPGKDGAELEDHTGVGACFRPPPLLPRDHSKHAQVRSMVACGLLSRELGTRGAAVVAA